jgi:hypothetical protein
MVVVVVRSGDEWCGCGDRWCVVVVVVVVK